MIKRFAFSVALMVVLAMVFSGMAMALALDDTATVSLTVPPVLEIVGLDDFSLTLPGVPGTATGSDVFTVKTNNALGATVSGAISAFNPTLTNAASVAAMLDVPQGSTDRTATVSVAVVLTDAPGDRTATLTITVTNKV